MADDSTKKDGASYYYAIGGSEHGPVDKARIIQLAQMGSIRPTTHVWTDAMPVKTAAGKLPFLTAHLRRGSTRGTQLLVGGVAAAVGVGVLAAFLWMVPPAAAREGESACRGLLGLERLKPAMCPDGQSCEVPVQAPDFSMISKDGKQVKLSEFRGKYVLLNFWASWCGTCKAEKPGLAELSREFPDLEVVALSSDSEWSKVLISLVQSLRPNARLPSPAGAEYTFDEAKAIYGARAARGPAVPGLPRSAAGRRHARRDRAAAGARQGPRERADRPRGQDPGVLREQARLVVVDGADLPPRGDRRVAWRACWSSMTSRTWSGWS